MFIQNRKKAAASAAFAALAATAVLGGGFAQFTDRDSTTAQELTAGTVEVNLTEGANWDTSNLLLGVDDTVVRELTVTNDGNLDIKGVVLSANVVDAPGLDPTANLSDGVTVTIEQDGVALAEDVVLSEVTDYDLDFAAGLAPAASTELVFTYKVVATADADDVFTDGDNTVGERTDFATNPDNRFQGASVSVDYTVDAVQRDGIDN